MAYRGRLSADMAGDSAEATDQVGRDLKVRRTLMARYSESE